MMKRYTYREVKSGSVTTFEIGEIDFHTTEFRKEYPDSWADRRICEGFWGDEAKCKIVVDLLNSTENESILFADWLNNNWFIPAETTGFWKMELENIEFRNSTGLNEKEVFTTDHLYREFKNGKGEF